MYKVLSIVLLFLFMLPGVAFAQEYTVTGLVTDETQNPIPASKLEFINSDGKSIGSVESSYDGSYEIQVENGTYEVGIEGPDGSGIGKVEYDNQIVNGDTKLDYVLGIDEQDSEQVGATNYLIIVISAIVAFLILFGILFFHKRKR